MRTERTSRFIVLEGLDGSGTTTQAKLLTARLESLGIDTFPTFEPTDGPAGKLIRDVLSGRLHTPGSDEKIVLPEKTLCLLFGADRLDHTRAVERALASGPTVVCDRYILSSLAYQTLDPGISPEWVIEVNRGCARPDLTILLALPAALCLERLKLRRGTQTLYEKRTTLEAIEKNYGTMIPLYRERFGPVVTIDGGGRPDAILEEIVAAIRGTGMEI